MPHKRKDLLIFTFLLFLVVAFFHRFLIGQEIFAFKDLSRYFYPLRYLMVSQVKSGMLPLWNPFIAYGMPLLATLQIGFLYLPTLIYYIMPFDLAFNYYILLHYFGAAVFMYILARYLGFARPAGALSSIVFTFSGYLMSVANMNTSLTSVIWLPMVFMWFDKTIKQRSLRPAIVLSIFWALMFLGGEPTIIYMTTLLMIGWAVFSSENIKGSIKNIGWLAISQLGFILLAAAQLMPFIELALHSHRVGKISYELITYESLPIRETLNFILPYFFGNPLRAASYSALFLKELSQSWMLSPYVGVIPLVLCVLAFLSKNKRMVYFFSGVVVFSLILAFGKYTPVYYLLYKFLPGFSMIRYPVKHLFLASFSLALLSGIGWSAFLEKQDISRWFIRALAGSSILVGSITFFAWIMRDAIFLRLLSPQVKLTPYLTQTLKNNIEFNLLSGINLTVLLILSAVMFFLFKKRILRASAFSCLIIGLLFLDYFGANANLNMPNSKACVINPTPNIEIMLKDKSLFRFHYSQKLGERGRMLFGEDYDQGLIDNKDQLAANRLIIHGLYDTSGYTSMRLKDWLVFSDHIGKQPLKVQRRIMDLLNVKYIADAGPLRLGGTQFLRKAEYFYGESYFYRNGQALPRAFFVGRSKVFKERQNILKYMVGDRFAPKYEIALEEGTSFGKKNLFRRVEIVDYKPNLVRIISDSSEPGYVFLSDTYYPGWKAYIDGKRSKILRANYMFRAVKVDKGRHEIKYVYDPLSFKLGALVSLLSILAFAIAFFSLGKLERT